MSEEVRFYEDLIHMDYARSPGEVIGYFLGELKEKGNIYGIRSDVHGHIFVPPQLYDPHTGKKMEEWVKVSPYGEVCYFTIVQESLPFIDLSPPPPYAFVGIRLEGVHSILWHRVEEVKNLKVGSRVQAVFKPKKKRTGSILDIAHFKLI